jgi:Taurine catabolism dioxygenase TauD, TfdA family
MVLLQCLDAASHATGGDERWVSARAVARRLSPTARQESVAEELTRLYRLGLVEMWFRGGSTYYRGAR